MKRKPDESFEDYKKRRQEEETETHTKLKGKVFWNSTKLGPYRQKDK